jgi:uncharacterized coiled-coil protein SlyX
MEQTLLTVAEFVAREGISKQAVYKRLNNRFNRFVVKVDGRLMIDAAAYDKAKQEQAETRSNSTVEQPFQPFQPVQPLNNSTVENELRRRIAEQEETIIALRKELEEARADVRRKDEQLEAQAARLLTITEKQQELLYNSQVLQVQAQQKRGFFARLFAPKQNKSGE